MDVYGIVIVTEKCPYQRCDCEFCRVTGLQFISTVRPPCCVWSTNLCGDFCKRIVVAVYVRADTDRRYAAHQGTFVTRRVLISECFAANSNH